MQRGAKLRPLQFAEFFPDDESAADRPPGDAEAFGRRIPRVYDHLRRLARLRLAGERPCPG